MESNQTDRTRPAQEYASHRTRRPRRLRATLLALTAAGGLLLTGCSAGGGSNTSSADGANRTGFPAPAPAVTSGGEQRNGQSEEGEQTDSPDKIAPSPDYLSTFALDVDTASYGYARRVLADGQLPDPSTIRPEEFVNSFRQDYERPDGNGFTVTVDGARTDSANWSLVRVGLATRTADDNAERPPAALTFEIGRAHV